MNESECEFAALPAPLWLGSRRAAQVLFGLSAYREEYSPVIPEHAMPRTETQLREHFERALNAARQERAVPSGLMLTLDVIGLLREIAAIPDVPETLVERARAAFEDQLSDAFAAAEREAIVVAGQLLSVFRRVVVSQLLDNRSIGEPEQVELGLRFQRPRHPGRHDEQIAGGQCPALVAEPDMTRAVENLPDGRAHLTPRRGGRVLPQAVEFAADSREHIAAVGRVRIFDRCVTRLDGSRMSFLLQQQLLA